MNPDSSSVDPNTFLRSASWQCVRTTNATAVARALGLLHYQPATLPQDLAGLDPGELPAMVVTGEDWTYVFGMGLGLRGARQLSSEFGEALAFHVDERTGTYRCERAREGEVLRRVYVSEQDSEHDSFGEATTGEPPVPWLDSDSNAAEIGLSGADVLRFAAAWGADPKRALRRTSRAFVASNKPMITRPAPTRSVLATVLGLLVVGLVLGGGGGAVWWLLQSDQEEAAAQFCENQWGCSGCVGCTASVPHPCSEAFQACQEKEACSALIPCLSNCLDLGARTGFYPPGEGAEPCFAKCRETHAEGLEAYCTWTECSYRSACSDLCTDPGFAALAACD